MISVKGKSRWKWCFKNFTNKGISMFYEKASSLEISYAIQYS